MAASTEEIKQILQDVHLALERGSCIVIPRRKNMDTLAKLGLTWQDAKDEIYELCEEDYCKGPCVDRDYPQTDAFWIFKRRVCGEVIYIKFKVLYQKDREVRVVSFHIDEVP